MDSTWPINIISFNVVDKLYQTANIDLIIYSRCLEKCFDIDCENLKNNNNSK